MQERRPPLKIHFTIQLGYFTGVKKRRRGDARVYSSTIYGLVYLHFMVENGATAGRQTLSCFTLPPSYSKNDFTTRTIISESHLKSCFL